MFDLTTLGDLFKKTTLKGFYRVNGRVFLKRDDYILELPSFYHDYAPRNTGVYPENHTFKGNFNRHLSVESALLSLRILFMRCPFADAFIGIFFGLNCNFPAKDVARFFIWQIKGEIPLHFFMIIHGEWMIAEGSMKKIWYALLRRARDFHL